MDQQQIEKSSVNKELRSLINDYLKRHPSLTLNALATRSGIPGTTLRRLVQDENRSEVAAHTVLQLVSYVYKEKRISHLLNMCEGEIGSLLKKCYDQFIFSEEEKVEHKLNIEHNELFKDETNYIIYKLAANKFGTSRVELEKAVGMIGLRKLDQLIKNNVLVEESDGRIHAIEKNFSVDLELAHKLTHVLVDFYKPNEVDKGYNLFYSLSEGLNDEGIKKVKEIEKEAVKKVFEVMNSDQYMGLIPYFSIFMSDVLGSYEAKLDEKLRDQRVVQ